MRCDRCGAYRSRDASHCRRCGGTQRNLPVPVTKTAGPPALWEQAAPALARGVALVALGVVGEMALTALAKGALRLPALRRPAKSRPPTRRNGEEPEGSYAVSETVVMRRVVIRR